MTLLPFIKMHGCGNDYVYVDCFENRVPENPGALSIAVSDRHRGVGSDGLVLMLPPDVRGAAARMRMFNADGSEGALCGNALRCMAMWLHQTGRSGSGCTIAMADRQIQTLIVQSDPGSHSAMVRITIGEPLRLNPSAADQLRFVLPISLMDVSLPMLIAPVLQVSMGNPHTVLFVESLDGCDVHGLGRRLEHHVEFPNRTNVEFVEVTGRSSASVRIWERGSGETLACGSGASAVTVAGIVAGLFDSADPVTIHMPGGDLQVHWDEANLLHLEGPAQESFRGTLAQFHE